MKRSLLMVALAGLCSVGLGSGCGGREHADSPDSGPKTDAKTDAKADAQTDKAAVDLAPGDDLTGGETGPMGPAWPTSTFARAPVSRTTISPAAAPAATTAPACPTSRRAPSSASPASAWWRPTAASPGSPTAPPIQRTSARPTSVNRRTAAPAVRTALPPRHSVRTWLVPRPASSTAAARLQTGATRPA
jgi:hypothetical protein